MSNKKTNGPILNTIKDLWAIPIVRAVLTAGLNIAVSKLTKWIEKKIAQRQEKKNKK